MGFSGWQDVSVQGATPATFHLNPTTTNIVLNVTDAPNLTATVEGPLTNNSILLVNDTLWVNGSALSLGASPTALAGDVQFAIRANGSGDEWIEVFNLSATGAFSIPFQLPPNLMVAAGEIETRLRFFPSSLPATDDADLTAGAPYFLRGLLTFQVQESSQVRGQNALLSVQINDHRGVTAGADILGNYDLSFNGSWFNTTVDPTLDLLEVPLPLDANLRSGDYAIDIVFNGSSFYQPSTGNGSIRVMADIGWNLSIGQDWTYMGNSTRLFGDVFDSVYLTPVLNNTTLVTVSLFTEQGPIDVAQATLNNSTGAFDIPIVMPTNLPSDAYEFVVDFDFLTQAPLGGPYYTFVDSAVPPAPPTLISQLGGIITEVVVEAERPAYIVEMNDTVSFNAKITDVADNSNISGAPVDYIWDYGNTNQSLGVSTTDSEGNATFDFTPSGIAPGFYDLAIVVQDDLSAALAAGNTRRYGNISVVNVTVQVVSDINLVSVPSTVTAGVPFSVIGQVEDGENASRTLISAVRLNVFWLENPEELLLSNFATTNNGSFNMTVPTDTAGNGTTRGPHTLVITVVNESSPFYLTATAQSPVQVMGVSRLENLQPLNAVVINRGNDINMSAKLVEASDLFAPLSNYEVGLQFHETWLAPQTTDGEGFANFTFSVPYDHPLGLIVVQMVFNGSNDLLSTSANLTSITVRSLTFLVVDPIVANPVAGTSFNISGQIVSDNDSGLVIRDGSVLPNANVLFSINGQPSGFTATGGAIGVDGYWNATIRLSETFAAGTHLMEATYIPNVNYYVGSQNNSSFDSRGFSVMNFIVPSLDGIGQPSLNDRTERGTQVDFTVLLRDNQGLPMANQSVVVSLTSTMDDASPVQITVLTAANGTAWGNLTVPATYDVGPTGIHADYAGIAGTTGIIGTNATSQFVVLAQTEVQIVDAPTVLVAGDTLVVNGTLLDDLGMVLKRNGENATAIVHLLIDGVPVASVETDNMTGAYTLTYTLPEDTAAGPHVIGVEFRGGREWVDPVGYGDTNNPEYYMPSSATVDFNVSVPTKILLLTATGDADRETTMTIQGRLLDVVDNPLPNMTIEIWLGGQWLTNTTTDDVGEFSAVHPVPADAPLGPVVLETRFTGTVAYLPSNATGLWEIFSPVLVTVDISSPVAVNETVTITGSVVDNQLVGIANHEVQLVVEGIVINTLSTDNNGDFTFQWVVPDIFDFGNRTLVAEVAPQGYYRSGEGNVSFFLSHRSWVTLLFDDGIDATRGDTWELSGRLYDFDTVDRDGLVGFELLVQLDGNTLFTTTTGADGAWSATVPATMDLTRGDHTISVVFEGTQAHLPAEAENSVRVWADLLIQVDPATRSSVVTRSDGVFEPIFYSGSVQEVGGSGEVFENLLLSIGNGSDCENGREGARCFPTSVVSWSNGNFSLEAIAPYWLEVGSQYFFLDVARNDTLYLNAASISQTVFVQVDAAITVDLLDVVEGEQEEVGGSLIVIAEDTKAGLPGIDIVVYLYDANQSQLANRGAQTDENGRATFIFEADPPYGDTDVWGQLTMDIIVNDPRLSAQSIQAFETLRSEGFAPQYEFAEEQAETPWWSYLLVLVLAALVAGGVVMYRRKKIADDLLKDAAEVFAYTAELLAAGDAIREAIFTCYQDLCGLLQQRGFLRRDFETVREFEFAIRQALQGVSEDALTALDNTFEMARYSREEMGAQHQDVALQALNRMAGEIAQMQAIPQR